MHKEIYNNICTSRDLYLERSKDLYEMVACNVSLKTKKYSIYSFYIALFRSTFCFSSLCSPSERANKDRKVVRKENISNF